MDSDEGGGEQLGWQLTGQLGARIGPRKKVARTCKVLEQNFMIKFTESSSF
jgi:hypothetical protein